MKSGHWRDWIDEQSGRLFIAPAVAVVLAFSIFPLGVSALLSVSRFSLQAGGVDLAFIGALNYRRLLLGSQQYHFLGTQGELPVWGGPVLALVVALFGAGFVRSMRGLPDARRWTAGSAGALGCLLAATLLAPLGPFQARAAALIEAADVPWFAWLGGVALSLVALALLLQRLAPGRIGIAGWCGRLLAATFTMVLAMLVIATGGRGGQPGSMLTTLFYVVGGTALQFALGLGLAMLCAQNIRGRDFFRLSFFLPLMVTPVGVAYTFRMLADMSVGPLAPLARWFGMGALTWAQDAWSARWVVLLSDAWQWTPFMFIVLLAAVEGQSREQVEAAQLDGASSWRVFRDITWPGIAPTAAALVLIRLIEGFKIVDLPNVLTNGGPGIATESMTLHAFIDWRTLNLGGSAAVAYMLLFVATVSTVSFFQFVVRPARGPR
ncbi:sugar ABC transporter permease [Piscinibacter sp. XHJ-5]|uniref:carbohydrate ABC transporter permease n=1 Tax=Piscinibacter sp. XHJ-5 TaxID=3037797 RepID=UPI002452D4F8|nr:sugar ABC transporter permease [Piscinibacter sp. XHJ-5]